MESNLSNALLLMVIGMISVFLVLLIVVTGGSLLINLVNKYAPESTSIPTQSKNSSLEGGEISKTTMAVIAAAVMHVTGGKGHIDKVIKK